MNSALKHGFVDALRTSPTTLYLLRKELERRPGGRIRIRHPFAVHRRIERDGQDGHDERIVRQARLLAGQTLRQLMHGGLRHTVANHTRGTLEGGVRSRQHQQTARLQMVGTDRRRDGGRPHRLLPHEIGALGKVLLRVTSGPTARDADDGVERFALQFGTDLAQHGRLLRHPVGVTVHHDVGVGRIVFRQIDRTYPLPKDMCGRDAVKGSGMCVLNNHSLSTYSVGKIVQKCSTASLTQLFFLKNCTQDAPRAPRPP